VFRVDSEQLSGKAGCDLIERRPRSILGLTRGSADVNEAGDTLMRRQAKGVKHAAIVRVPFGDPVCSVTVRGEHKAHGGGTGGELPPIASRVLGLSTPSLAFRPAFPERQ
jgi:hypothetical protein